MEPIEEEKLDLDELQLTHNTLFKRFVPEAADDAQERTRGSSQIA